MTLAMIMYPPPTERGMEEWLHAHIRHHEAIADAVRTTLGVTLDILPIYPGKVEDDQWSRDHQEMHNAMSGALGLAGTDITRWDTKNKRKSDDWVYIHFEQHRTAASACGLPI